jgi:hypothetical protein
LFLAWAAVEEGCHLCCVDNLAVLMPRQEPQDFQARKGGLVASECQEEAAAMDALVAVVRQAAQLVVMRLAMSES